MNGESFVVGQSRHIEEIRGACATFGPFAMPVTITGETGTGKSVVAAELHRRSRRANEPLVRIAASELSAELIQGTMAGNVKGAFTSADTSLSGLLEPARGGTVWLDDVQDLALDVQPYLLDCVESKPLRPVRGQRTFIPDVRWIVGTQVPLRLLAEQGRLKRDLVARFGVASIDLVPLRRHKEDIPVLAPHLLGRAAARENVPTPTVGRNTLDALARHDWPDNVRELESALYHGLVLAVSGGTDRIEPRHLPAALRVRHRRSAEARVSETDLRDALSASAGVLKDAALALDVTPRTIYRKMKSFGMRGGTGPVT